MTIFSLDTRIYNVATITQSKIKVVEMRKYDRAQIHDARNTPLRSNLFFDSILIKMRTRKSGKSANISETTSRALKHISLARRHICSEVPMLVLADYVFRLKFHICMLK